MKEFRDFESAREFVRKLGLKRSKEWNDYCKSGNKPDDIPTAPWKIYKKDFKGMGDFLGTGNVASYNKQFLPFAEAREFVQKLGLKNRDEWFDYCKSGKKPDDIPSSPKNSYKNKGWVTWGHWLGTGIVADRDKVFRPFKEAREFARSLGLKSTREWREYYKSGNKPDDIPSAPNGTYKKDFKGYGNWLGTGIVADRDKVFRPFKEARDFTQSLGLKSTREWERYCKSGNKPDDIPSAPNGTYKKEWEGWGDWTGNGKTRNFRSFSEAREFVRSLKLKGQKEWAEYCTSGNKPNDIPSNPWRTYKKWKKK